jgi:hypothetical protein
MSVMPFALKTKPVRPVRFERIFKSLSLILELLKPKSVRLGRVKSGLRSVMIFPPKFKLMRLVRVNSGLMSVMPFALKPKLVRPVRVESGPMSPMLLMFKLRLVRLVSVDIENRFVNTG